MLAIGDLFYDTGLHDISDFKNLYEVNYKINSYDIPWYAAIGNHDCKSEEAIDNFFKVGSTYSNWKSVKSYYL